MEQGTKVTLSKESTYNDGDRHNPIDVVGTVKEYVSEFRVIVDWGGFTNSYRVKDLFKV